MSEHTRATRPDVMPGATRTADNTPQAEGLIGRVREQAAAQLNTQKNKATDGLGSMAHAFRGSTERLRQEQHGTVARYAEQAADQIERLSERLRNKDVGELLTDAQSLARRRPALFVGGAFAVGLLGARFLKSSPPRDYQYTPTGERSWQNASTTVR